MSREEEEWSGQPVIKTMTEFFFFNLFAIVSFLLYVIHMNQ